MGFLDDLVAFGVTDEENFPRAYIKTEDKTVKTWAELVYERYLMQATEVNPNKYLQVEQTE